MKRDWDLIRQILVAIEEKADRSHLSIDAIPCNDVDSIYYNLGLLLNSGFIEGEFDLSLGMGSAPRPVYATGLSWRGHELLDSIRQDSTWQHIKSTAISKGLDLTIDVVSSLAKAYISAKIGIPM